MLSVDGVEIVAAGSGPCPSYTSDHLSHGAARHCIVGVVEGVHRPGAGRAMAFGTPEVLKVHGSFGGCVVDDVDEPGRHGRELVDGAERYGPGVGLGLSVRASIGGGGDYDATTVSPDVDGRRLPLDAQFGGVLGGQQPFRRLSLSLKT